jgi:glyoxylase-like metal-dependent hydrolase (beta-lactamase superfamily II)
MNLYKIETGNFKLDGGAMFGVVPKTLWQKAYPADENNLCNLSMRCLLLEDDKRKILIDAGIGSKQDEKFFGHYFLNGDDSLDLSLKKVGTAFEEITDVILTHLHFDHCGGAVIYDKESDRLKPAFANASYWVSKDQWKWALSPNAREKASYLKENFFPLFENNQLKFIDQSSFLYPKIEIRLFYGHTAGMIIPLIHIAENKTLVYVADLFPTTSHIPIAWVCGYDTQPLVSMKEREDFLNEAFQKNYTFFFEHDIQTECCTLKQTEKGIRPDRLMLFKEFLNE